ncbi:MAG TPA: hypothetical protein VF903_10560 [Nitrospirota bacterium]
MKTSRPVAGSAGDLLPSIFIQLIQVIPDKEVLAARRAAKRHRASTDAEFDSLAADFALHKNLDKPRRHEGTEKSVKGGTKRAPSLVETLKTFILLCVSVPLW